MKPRTLIPNDKNLDTLLRNLPVPQPDGHFELRIVTHALNAPKPNTLARISPAWRAAACLLLFVAGYYIGDLVVDQDHNTSSDTFALEDETWDI